MKLFSALALVAGVAAADRQTSCPPNSALLTDTYTDMSSCQCDSGYQAYAAPGWGCFHTSSVYTCPPNSQATIATPASFEDCSCDTGYVGYQNSCAFAYIFHVHGRVWLAPLTKADFTHAKEKEFRQEMANTINFGGVTWKDVLPYSIHPVQNIETDLRSSRLDHSKIVLGFEESGELSLPQKAAGGMSIGFAVHEHGTSMTLANQLVAQMKSSLGQNIWEQSVKTVFPSVTYTATYLWALTGAFWHRPTKSSYTWAPTKASTAYPTTAPGTTIAPTVPTSTPFCKAEIEATFYLRCDCPTSGTACTSTEAMTANGYLTMHRFTAQKRAAFIIGASNILPVDQADMSIKTVSPIDRSTDYSTGNGNTANTWYNPVSYTPSHKTWEGVAVTLSMKTYTMAEANTLLGAVRDINLGTNLVNELAANQNYHIPNQCLIIQRETLNPKPCPGAGPTIPTPMPTAAPTQPVYIPGSRDNCDAGTVMEIKGVARLQAADKLADADQYMKKVRTCMAAEATTSTTIDSSQTPITWCNINVQQWTETTFTIRQKESPIAEQGLHTVGSSLTPDQFNTAGADQIGASGNRRLAVATTCNGCNIYTYTFVFVLNVPGQNMHVGNEVFDAMHSNTHHFLSKANLCIGNTQYVPPLASNGNTFRPVVPVLESMNVSSIRYTYIAPALTAAPTPRATAADKNCQFSDWSGWTTCSAACGGGSKSKFRVVIEAHAGAGTCDTTKETSPCNTAACAIDCSLGEWGWNGVDGTWSTCTKSCGWGEQTATRPILNSADAVDATNGIFTGTNCPASTRTKTRRCNPVPCPIDCVVSAWSAWSKCNKRCGGGHMRKFRTITQTSYYYGKQCPDLEEQATCNSNACPTNCEVSTWSAWGSCDQSCSGQPAGTRLSGAKQERTRYVTTPAAFGGHPCPALTQTKLCALHPCGAHVCTTSTGFPLTCTYENDIVYTHHVNDVHDNELFMCYHNVVTEVCTCLCWPKSVGSTHRAFHGASNVADFVNDHNLLSDTGVAHTTYTPPETPETIVSSNGVAPHLGTPSLHTSQTTSAGSSN